MRRRAIGGRWSRLPLLKGLDEAAVKRLLAGAEVRRFDKNSVLFSEGAAPDCLFVLLKGIVELFTGDERRDAAVLILWPQETFLPAAALFDEPYLLSARALSHVEALALDAAQVRAETRRTPALAARFTRILAGQFRMTVRHIKDLKLRSAPQRLGAFLLRIVDETGRQGCADLPVAKGTIASRLRVTPETLSRALRVLQEEGLLVRGSRVIITDRKRLELYCRPDPLIDGSEPELATTAT